jgi:hypothetical protein
MEPLNTARTIDELERGIFVLLYEKRREFLSDKHDLMMIMRVDKIRDNIIELSRPKRGLLFPSEGVLATMTKDDRYYKYDVYERSFEKTYIGFEDALGLTGKSPSLFLWKLDSEEVRRHLGPPGSRQSVDRQRMKYITHHTPSTPVLNVEGDLSPIISKSDVDDLVPEIFVLRYEFNKDLGSKIFAIMYIDDIDHEHHYIEVKYRFNAWYDFDQSNDYYTRYFEEVENDVTLWFTATPNDPESLHYHYGIPCTSQLNTEVMCWRMTKEQALMLLVPPAL